MVSQPPMTKAEVAQTFKLVAASLTCFAVPLVTMTFVDHEWWWAALPVAAAVLGYTAWLVLTRIQFNREQFFLAMLITHWLTDALEHWR
jgi:hypothetical protein